MSFLIEDITSLLTFLSLRMLPEYELNELFHHMVSRITNPEFSQNVEPIRTKENPTRKTLLRSMHNWLLLELLITSSNWSQFCAFFWWKFIQPLFIYLFCVANSKFSWILLPENNKIRNSLNLNCRKWFIYLLERVEWRQRNLRWRKPW